MDELRLGFCFKMAAFANFSPAACRRQELAMDVWGLLKVTAWAVCAEKRVLKGKQQSSSRAAADALASPRYTSSPNTSFC